MDMKKNNFMNNISGLEIFDFLQNLDLCNEVLDSEINSIVQYCNIVYKSANEVIFLENEIGNKFYFIYEGFIKIVKSDSEGSEVSVALLTEDDSFGEMGLLEADNKRNAGAVCLTDSILITIQIDNFKEILKSNSIFTFNLLLIYMKWLKDSNQLIKLLSLNKSEDGILNTIFILAEKFGIKKRGTVTIPLNLSHNELAKFSGTSRKNFTMNLKKLEEKMIIKRLSETREKQYIIIENYDIFVKKYIYNID